MRLPHLFYFLREDDGFYVTCYHDQSQLLTVFEKYNIGILQGDIEIFVKVTEFFSEFLRFLKKI